MNNLLIFGAGGHGKVVADAAVLSGSWERIAFVDDASSKEKVLGLPVIGSFTDAPALLDEYASAVVAIGDNVLRAHWMYSIEAYGYALPAICHPSAMVSPHACIGQGSVILAHAVVNPNAQTGKGCIINTASCIEHDNMLGDFVHLSPGSILGGDVHVGDFSWIGLGARVINGLCIGSRCILAAGATLLNTMEDSTMYAGTPAVKKKELK